MQTRRIPSALSCVAAVVLAATSMASEPLQIQSQGSVIAGGTLQQQPGTFDPLTPTRPDGQSYHGDHVYAFYRCR